MRSIKQKAVATAVAAAFIPVFFSGCTSGLAAGAPTLAQPAVSASVPARALPDFSGLIAQAGPAVVNISTTTTSTADHDTQVPFDQNDPMYQFFKLKGFPVGLGKVGAGMGVPMTKLMDGADAPVRWRNGEHQAVCDYVLGDVRMTTAIVEAIEARGELAWVTSKGTTSRVPMRELRPVEACLQDPLPDQSWMSTPLAESKFTGWLDAND